MEVVPGLVGVVAGLVGVVGVVGVGVEELDEVVVLVEVVMLVVVVELVVGVVVLVVVRAWQSSAASLETIEAPWLRFAVKVRFTVLGRSVTAFCSDSAAWTAELQSPD